MDFRQIERHYGGRAHALLDALGQAATRYAEQHASLALGVRGSFDPPGGRPSTLDPHLVVERQLTPECAWHVTVGFDQSNFLEPDSPGVWANAIDFDGTSTGWPPLRIPIYAAWGGLDRYGRAVAAHVLIDPIVIRHKDIDWEGRRWTASGVVDADWIIASVAELSFRHDTADAAIRARRDGRWERLHEAPHARGGQGAVWKVRDRDDPSGPRYAKKELFSGRSQTSGGYRRFAREVEVMGRLDHPNIVPLIDHFLPDEGTGRAGTPPFYVMPWADATLRDTKYLARQVRPVLEIGLGIADALAAAADQKIVHRDVKPANILLVGESGQPMLADFGICHLTSCGAEGAEPDRLTDTLQVVGSQDFTPPEARGGRLDEPDSRFDVFSLGKTLYWALSGGRLFPDAAFQDQRYDLRCEEWGKENVPLHHFYGVLERMVGEDPARRFASIYECRDAIRRALGAIDHATPFREGMYGREDTPEEVYANLSKQLAGLEGIARTDALQTAVAEAEAAARRPAAIYEKGGGGLPAAVGQPHAGGLALAAESAEHWLATGLVLVRENDLEAFAEWLSSATRSAREADGYEHAVSRQILSPAGVLAAYGAAVVAWRLRRFRILRVVVDAYCEASHRWIYHGIVGRRDPVFVQQWITQALGASTAFRLPRTPANPDLSSDIRLVSGLAILRDLDGQSDDDLRQFVAHGTPRPIRAPYPGLFPQEAQWIGDLVTACRDVSAIEKGLAREVFDGDPETWRAACARVTPALARILASAAGDPNDGVYWHLNVAGAAWSAWCGGKP